MSRADWRPAGGWRLLFGVLALVLGFGVGGVVAFAAVQDQPPTVIRLPTPSASTSYRTLIIRPATHPAPRDTSGLGQASVPGVPYTPTERPSPTPDPSPTPTASPTHQTPTEVASPVGPSTDTQTPTPGVSDPGSPTSPGWGM